LSKSNNELQEKLSSLQVSASLQESHAIPLALEKQRLETQLDTNLSHAKWLEQELVDKSNVIQKLRQDHADHTMQLELQLDQTRNEKDAAVARLQALQQMERALQTKVQELSRDILEKKQQVIDVAEQKDLELQEERRVVELQSKQLEHWQYQFHDVVRENQSLQAAAAEAMQVTVKEKESLRQELECKYQVLLKEQAAELQARSSKQQQQQLVQTTAASAARPALGLRDDPHEPVMNLTELYTAYQNCKDALRQETTKREHAEFLFARVQMDVEAAATSMHRQRAEYELATDQLEEYQDRLTHALEERDFARQDTAEARHEAATLRRELYTTKAETELLARQVQALLVSRSGVAEGSTDIPTSVAEMQNQNQRLLVEHRRLNDMVADLEAKLETDPLKVKVDAYEAELVQLREDRKEQEIKVDKLVRQRDLYRATMMEGGSNLLGSPEDERSALDMVKHQSERAKKLEQTNTSLEADLAFAKGEADKARREAKQFEERLKRHEIHASEMTDLASQRERDLLTARSQVARAESESQYYKDKCGHLEASLQRARDEIAQVGNAKNELQRISNELHQAVSKAKADCARQEGEKQQAEMKLRLAETQLQTARAAESRLAEENRQLRNEIARQGSTMENIRRIEESLSAKNQEEVLRAQEEAERLSQQLIRDQSKHEAQVENLNGRMLELDARVRDLDGAKEKAQSELHETKSLLLDNKTLVQELSAKKDTLESQLRAARSRLGETGVDDETDVELSLRTRIKVLVAELDTAKADVASMTERATNYQKIAEEHESALAEITTAIEAMKTFAATEKDELIKSIETLKKDAASKQEIVAELTNDLASHRSERETSEAKLTAEILALKTELTNDAENAESSKAEFAAMKLDMEVLRAEIESAQNNYERELSVHSESRTALRKARELADEESRLRRTLQDEVSLLKHQFDQARTGWEKDMTALQESLKLTEMTLAAAREQSTALHQQVETLGEAVQKNQAARISAATDPSSTGIDADSLQKTVSELRQIVKSLRSENEFIQTKLDNAKRMADSERAAANVIKRSLDEARAELQVLQARRANQNSDQPGETKALSEKLKTSEEQMALLKDSNQILRETTLKLENKLSAVENELRNAKIALQPAEKSQQDMLAKISTLEAENESLMRDLDDWKNRVKSIVSRFNQIDPEEHNQLKKKVEESAREINSLTVWKRTTEEENTRMRNIAKALKERNDALKREVQELKSVQVSASHAASTSLTQERDELKGKVSELEKEAATRKAELLGATEQTGNLRNMLRKFNVEVRELRAAVKTSDSEISTLQLKNSELELKLSKKGVNTAADKQLVVEPVVQSPEVKSPEVATKKPAALPSASEVPVLERKPSAPTALKVPEKKPSASATIKVPSVPPEGFNFGPSADVSVVPSLTPVATQREKRATAAISSTLKADAAPFVFQPAVTLPLVSVTAQNVEVVAQKSVVPVPVATETSTESGGKQELTIREKLLEKKRKLTEAKARQLAAKKANEEAVSQADDKSKEPKREGEALVIDEQPKKKSKVDEAVEESQQIKAPAEVVVANDAPLIEQSTVESEVSQEKANVDDVYDNSAEGNLKDEVIATNDAPQIEEGSGVQEDSMPVDELDSNDAEEVDIDEEEEGKDEATDLAPAKKSIPFGSVPSANPSGLSYGSSVTLFGQSTSNTGFGSSGFGVTPTAGGFGKATSTTNSETFLNMQPPGSSETVPLFSFGNSGSITLPTPTIAPLPSNPFAFGSGGTTFAGTFAQAGMSSTPLFGSAVQPFASTTTAAAPSPPDDGMEDEVIEDDNENMDDDGNGEEDMA
jgi:nucleoprotein TPR